MHKSSAVVADLELMEQKYLGAPSNWIKSETLQEGYLKNGIASGKIKDDNTLMELNFIVDPNFGTLAC